jgi:hypothetical protein
MVLVDGSPVPEDGSHRELKPDGMQKAYVVLSEEERKKGYVKPLRKSYVHDKCGVLTTMHHAIAETYARNPNFYSGTFCVGCSSHYPLREFKWEDGEPMDTSLQAGWAEQTSTRDVAKRERQMARIKHDIEVLQEQLHRLERPRA